MIYNIPLETLEERYSKQWNAWFPEEMNRLGIWFNTIPLHTHEDHFRLTNKIRSGSFLDIVDTNYFKSKQLSAICKLFNKNKIMPGDVFFFHDLWFPGIEMLAYMRDALKIDFKIAGILHAGSYDEHDMLHRVGMTKWAKWIEKGWFKLIDYIFVATQFHKGLILDKRCHSNIDWQELDNKIHITGLPIYPEFANPNPWKRFDVIFPHRLDPEKNPHMFDQLVESIGNSEVKLSKWNFLKTKEVAKTKQEYYNMLNNGSIAVSFAEQETWGIAMQEAVMCGCIPLVPNRLSYQEMYPAEFRFHNFGQCEGMIVKLITDQGYFDAMKVMAEILSQKFVMKGRMAIEKMMIVLEEI